MGSLPELSDELVLHILSFCDIIDLIARLQLINTRFRALIQHTPSILRKLTFRPGEGQPLMPTTDLRAEGREASEELMQFRHDLDDFSKFWLNPMIHRLDLLSLFLASIDEHDRARQTERGLSYWDVGWSRHLVCKTPWLADASRRAKWLRKDASWRKFLFRCTNDTVIRRLDVCSEAFNLLEDDHDNWARCGYVNFEDQKQDAPVNGMTIGDLYDLLTIPELGLFKQGLKHNLVWELKLGSTWSPGRMDEYDEVPGRACLFVCHALQDGPRGHVPVLETPQDHGNLVLSDEACEGVKSAKSEQHKADDSDAILPYVRDYAVDGKDSIIDSGRLKITWEDEYVYNYMVGPDSHTIMCDLPNKHPPPKMRPHVMKYRPETRQEYFHNKELNIKTLQTMKELGQEYMVTRTN